jgi:hypothetical protein
MMLAVFGLNQQVFSSISKAEKNRFFTATIVFLVSTILSLIACVRFMYQLSDSYFIGIFGGILVGIIITFVVRIALITLISLPLHHQLEKVDSPSINLSGFSKIREILPSFSVWFRLGIIVLMAIIVALPLASLAFRNTSRQIVENRRAEVRTQFLANHPELPSEKTLILDKNLAKEHFPIRVYRELALNTVGIGCIMFCLLCFLFPFITLLHLRKGKQFSYATLNRNHLLKQIETDYSNLCRKSEQIQKIKYGLSAPIMPNQCWIDAPFNTRNISDKPPYTFEDQKTFFEYLKSI